MSRWDAGLSEPDRHAVAVALEPHRFPVPDYIRALADPSWRVRRAALRHVRHYARDPAFVESLVLSLSSEDNAGLRNAASEALVRLGPAAVPSLASSLEESGVDVRKFVVEALGLIGGDGAERALYTALEDSDLNVRAAAAEALGRIGGITTAEHLTRTLDERGADPQTAAYLLDALANMQARVPLAKLVRFWDVPVLRRSLYSVLGLTGDPGAIPLLIDGTAYGSKRNRAVAITALAHLLNQTQRHYDVGQRLRVNTVAMDSVLGALDDESDAVVSAAVVLASTLQDPSVAPRLLEACACRTVVEVGMAAVDGLGGDVVDHLLGEIYRVGIESRVLFLEAVEFLGNLRHVDDLLEVAGHSDTRTAEAAVRAIGRIGGASAVAGLMSLARDSDEELELQVAHAMAEIGRRHPESTAEAVVGAIRGGEVRAGWLTVLGAVGRLDDIELVRNALNHHDSSVRIAAYDAANLYGERFPVDSLVLGLTDESSRVRARAARALGNHRSQGAVDALLAAVKDRESAVVAEAVRSLGGVGGPKVLATLKAAVSSRDAVVALAALHALFRLNPPELKSWLKPAFEHYDPEVVREAVSVTVRLSEADALPYLFEGLEHRFWMVRRASADALAGREARVPAALLEARLLEESEALVVESLRRLEVER